MQKQTQSSSDALQREEGEIRRKKNPWQRTNPTFIPLPICPNTRNLLEFYLGLETGANRWRGGRFKSLHSRCRSFSCHKITHQKHLSIPNEAENFGPSITHTHTNAGRSINELYTHPIPLFRPAPPTNTNELQSVARINERDVDRPAV